MRSFQSALPRWSRFFVVLFILFGAHALLEAVFAPGSVADDPIPVVTPGETVADPPSDAIVLFEGTDLSKWKSRGKGEEAPARWKVENGYAEQNNTGSISTKEVFGDCQIHVEWRAPTPPKGRSQGRGNSGIIVMGRYEVQVLDSYENPTYPNGAAAAIYGQHPPLFNACRKPGEWQTYDIIFRAPRLEGKDTFEPARVTVLHNGVLVQHESVLRKRGNEVVGPLVIQDHGDRQPMRFRNIWLRKLDLAERVAK